ncbi:hypothetical protein FACS1894198_3280 [Clostridia bacterium]|nr:hypothetical protein FACS1894198_3280 [Clostridia bacterium]
MQIDGLIGMNRDIVVRMMNLIHDSQKIRNIVGIAEKTYSWLSKKTPKTSGSSRKYLHDCANADANLAVSAVTKSAASYWNLSTADHKNPEITKPIIRDLLDSCVWLAGITFAKSFKTQPNPVAHTNDEVLYNYQKNTNKKNPSANVGNLIAALEKIYDTSIQQVDTTETKKTAAELKQEVLALANKNGNRSIFSLLREAGRPQETLAAWLPNVMRLLLTALIHIQQDMIRLQDVDLAQLAKTRYFGPTGIKDLPPVPEVPQQAGAAPRHYWWARELPAQEANAHLNTVMARSGAERSYGESLLLSRKPEGLEFYIVKLDEDKYGPPLGISPVIVTKITCPEHPDIFAVARDDIKPGYWPNP